MGDRTLPSLEHGNTRQTLLQSGMASRCRRNHGRSGSSLVSLMEPLHHWGHVTPLDGGTGEDDHEDSKTDTATPDDDDDIASVASQPSASLQPSSLQLPTPALTGKFAFAFPMVPCDSQLGAIFEDHGVSWLASDEMSALEWATHRWCLPAHPPPSARQRFNRQKFAFLLRDFAATADLPHHSAFFPPSAPGPCSQAV